MQAPASPPFATATLMRLYLKQGHLDSAEAMLEELRLRGEPGIEELEMALNEAKAHALAAPVAQDQAPRPNTSAATSHPDWSNFLPPHQRPAASTRASTPRQAAPSAEGLLQELLNRIAQRRRG